MQMRPLSFALLAALTSIQPAEALDWPERPVKIVVPFGPGGSSDVAARIIAQRLGDAFGQQFVVENRSGASGALAAELVARSSADGHTLLMATTGQISIIPSVTKVAYDPLKDFVPICVVGTNPFVLVVHPTIPARTVAELVAYVRAQPSQVAYASSGIGSIGHLSMELFRKRAGLNMIAVMYKGGTAQLNDVIAGHVKVTVLNLSAVAPFAASDAIRLLAVTSERRAPQIPDIPTFIESGFPSFKILNWSGLMAPAGTPKEIIDRIAGEVSRAVNEPKIAALLAGNGIDPVGGSPEEFAALLAADIPLWCEAAKIAGVQER